MNELLIEMLKGIVLPKEIADNFDIVGVTEDEKLVELHLVEKMDEEYQKDPKIKSKGLARAVRVRDFPMRGRSVDLLIRRRRWENLETKVSFLKSYEFKERGTRYTKELAAFLKG